MVGTACQLTAGMQQEQETFHLELQVHNRE